MPRSLHSKGYKALTALLVEARKSANLTQQELANRLKRPQSFVTKYEGGERRIDVIELIEICDAMGRRTEVLLRALLTRMRASM